MDPELNDDTPQLRSDLTEAEREAADNGELEAFKQAFGYYDAPEADSNKVSAKTATPTPAAAPAPADKSQPAKETDEKSGTADDDTDPFKDLHPKVRDMLAEVPTLKRNFDALHNRLAPVQQKLSQVERENADLRRQLDERATAPASKAAPDDVDTDELRQRVAGELPEVTDLITAEIRRAMKGMRPAEDPAPATPVAETSRATETSTEAQSLARVHPDWISLMNDTNYKLWVAGQPADFQQEVMSTNDPIIVADSLTKFKDHQKRAQERATEAQNADARRQNRTSRGLTPGGRSPPGGNVALSEHDAMLEGFNSR